MPYPLKERLGAWELFTNRQEERAYFDSWVRNIEKEGALSTAIVSHRKVGKTALLQRFYNDLFERGGNVIPFYLEIEEENRLKDEFSRIYYMTFISQLLSFKKKQWLGVYYSPEELIAVSRELKLDYIAADVERWQRYTGLGGAVLWRFTREAPHRLAEISGDRFVVVLDEFQNLNKYIYQSWPATPENQIPNMAGSYLGTCESKLAPMLITGSAVGMLMRLIHQQLPKRFEFYFLEKFKEQDFLELGYKLSDLYGVPTNDECLLLAHRLLGGHPAYLRDLFNSKYKAKALTAPQGVYEAYLFEVGTPKQGRIRAGWEEYLDVAFDEINQFNAKKIVLFLAKHHEQEWTRMEIKERCGLTTMDDRELERKLQALVDADLISQGRTSLDYQGLGDTTFDKVFRMKYEKEIEQITFEIVRQNIIDEFERTNRELKTALAAKTHEANVLRGHLNQKKGEIGELWIKSVIRNHSHHGRYFNPGELGNNAEKIRLPLFHEIAVHAFSRQDQKIEIDILCRPALAAEWHLAVEVKNREARQVSVGDVEKFAFKLQAFKEDRGEVKLQSLYYSFNGFQPAALEKLRELQIYWWDFDALDRLS